MTRNNFYQFSLSLLCLAILGACSHPVEHRGASYEAEKIPLITPRKTTKNDVLQTLGSPTSTSQFGPETWYYLSNKDQRSPFQKPRFITQGHVAIQFDEKNIVEQVKTYQPNDFIPHSQLQEKTKARGNDASFLQELFGNIGRFNPQGTGPTTDPTRSRVGTPNRR
jgi:outer membrane protein assembly factor BamE (lipoprotein component of BamABCDE complex)